MLEFTSKQKWKERQEIENGRNCLGTRRMSARRSEVLQRQRNLQEQFGLHMLIPAQNKMYLDVRGSPCSASPRETVVLITRAKAFCSCISDSCRLIGQFPTLRQPPLSLRSTTAAAKEYPYSLQHSNRGQVIDVVHCSSIVTFTSSFLLVFSAR